MNEPVKLYMYSPLTKIISVVRVAPNDRKCAQSANFIFLFTQQCRTVRAILYYHHYHSKSALRLIYRRSIKRFVVSNSNNNSNNAVLHFAISLALTLLHFFLPSVSLFTMINIGSAIHIRVHRFNSTIAMITSFEMIWPSV